MCVCARCYFLTHLSLFELVITEAHWWICPLVSHSEQADILRGHMTCEELSRLRYTVQFKLIGSHLWSFWNINHKSLYWRWLLKHAGLCSRKWLLFKHSSPLRCSTCLQWASEGSSQLCVCAPVSNTRWFFNLSFTNEGELLLDTTFNMKTANFWCLSFEQVCFFLIKKPQNTELPHPGHKSATFDFLYFDVWKDLPTNDSMKFISRYIFCRH